MNFLISSLIPKALATNTIEGENIKKFQIDYGSLNKAIGLQKTDKFDTSSLGTIIGSLLPYALTFAGLILLIMLIAGGFTLLTGATNQETQQKGKKQITTALFGFIIVFAIYWIAQALQIIFRVDIVG